MVDTQVVKHPRTASTLADELIRDSMRAIDLRDSMVGDEEAFDIAVDGDEDPRRFERAVDAVYGTDPDCPIR